MQKRINFVEQKDEISLRVLCPICSSKEIGLSSIEELDFLGSSSINIPMACANGHIFSISLSLGSIASTPIELRCVNCWDEDKAKQSIILYSDFVGRIFGSNSKAKRKSNARRLPSGLPENGVYLVKAGGLLKVGMSTNLLSRLSAYRPMNWIWVLKTPASVYDVGHYLRSVEAAFLAREDIAKFRIRNLEWYKYHPDVMSAFKSLGEVVEFK